MEVFVLLLLVCTGLTAAQYCSSNKIACADKNKCIVPDVICDDDADCDDASDEEEELCRGWVNARCPVKSVLCTRNGEESCVEIPEYCTISNPPCDGDFDKRICSMLEGGRLLQLSNFEPGGNLMRAEKLAGELRKVIPSTISHERCPTMYTLVGDSCVSLSIVSSMTWSEAQVFCDLLDGDLMTFHRDAKSFAAITQHLQTIGAV
ncbi:low-density lipoprotein receptor-related protein 1-like isoform X2 [Palaemon carinicauda]|uniref:low-density lipoprotein receptor-related protein 1-like isoform X2 n=1 Tax=Palaemon carinicauda TaxID=392227 RepID=UPI0035B6525E